MDGSSARASFSASTIDDEAMTATDSESRSSEMSPGPLRSGLSGTLTIPSSAVARYAYKSSMQLGRTSASLSPLRRPSDTSAFASWFTRSSSPAKVSRSSPQTTARWSGRKRACHGSSEPTFISGDTEEAEITETQRYQTRSGLEPPPLRL